MTDKRPDEAFLKHMLRSVALMSGGVFVMAITGLLHMRLVDDNLQHLED